MPVEFRMETRADDGSQPTRGCSRDSVRLLMAYDGSGRRVSKTRERKACISDEADGVYAADWERELVTHYTGIGTEVRENYRDGSLQDARVVVNMPQGLGRYGVEDAANSDIGFGAGYIPSTKFEWYLKNHLGSTMLVYGTQGSSNADVADLGEVKKAYDYRSFGEQIDLIADAGDKVTENFTGKEKDDETELNYFGARYLDPMLGLWTSVDPKRQFASPYLYVGNGMNPVNGVDGDGNVFVENERGINVGQIIYDNLMEKGFYGSDILRNDWNEMKNSNQMIVFDYSSMSDGAQSWKSLSKIDINSKFKNNLIMSAIMGRHEWDHLKGVNKATWHENPKEKFVKDAPYGDILGVNNAIREGSLPEDHEAFGKEYDPIYGRDYDAFMQLELEK